MMRASVGDRPARLEFEDVGARYGSVQALSHINLTVISGTSVALLGPNGAGKTSLLRAVVRAFGVQVSGQIACGGVALNERRTDEIARLGVVFVPADRRIFPFSVKENLRLAAGGRPGWLAEAMELIAFFPFLEPLLERRGDLLSGGEQQAVALVRACLLKPTFLLLDEPTEGLAPLAVRGVIDGLLHMREALGTTYVIADRSVELIEELDLYAVGLQRGELRETEGHVSQELIYLWTHGLS